MGTTVQKLTLDEFTSQYVSDKVFEFWYGEAIAKGMPTWIHGLLQQIIVRLLTDAGFFAASEVELRIDPQARPRPDVIASKTKPNGPYPTKGLDIVVEVLSEDDKFPLVREHCQKYQAWGFGRIFLVDPSNRSTFEWKNDSFLACTELADIPVARIWSELDSQYEPGT